MNRRGFFGLCAAAPVAAILPSVKAPTEFKHVQMAVAPPIGFSNLVWSAAQLTCERDFSPHSRYCSATCFHDDKFFEFDANTGKYRQFELS